MKQAKHHIICALLLIALCNPSVAARTVVQGAVRIDGGTGVDMANVVVSPANSPKTILGSTFTAENGSFSLTVNCD